MRWRRLLLGAAAVVLVVIGIVLVVTGTDDGPAVPSTTTATTQPGATPTVTLPLSDTSKAGVSSLAGLSLPAGTADFLSASVENATQLDVSFTLPVDQVGEFVQGSGFPALGDERVITHSSPLWKLNPEGAVRGAADTKGAVVRAVETVPEDGKVRVRLVITPAQ